MAADFAVLDFVRVCSDDKSSFSNPHSNGGFMVQPKRKLSLAAEVEQAIRSALPNATDEMVKKLTVDVLATTAEVVEKNVGKIKKDLQAIVKKYRKASDTLMKRHVDAVKSWK